MSRNPRRTTKRERAEVRRSNPIVCRTIGIAAAARLQRQRRMRPEADQLDRFARALGLEPLMTESGAPGVNHWSAPPATVAEQLQQSLEALHAATAARVAALKGHRPVTGGVDEDRGMPTYAASSGHEVEPDGWVNIKYPPHISLGPRLPMSGHRIAYTIIDDPMPGTEPGEYDLYVDADGTPTVDYSRGAYTDHPENEES